MLKAGMKSTEEQREVVRLSHVGRGVGGRSAGMLDVTVHMVQSPAPLQVT